MAEDYYVHLNDGSQTKAPTDNSGYYATEDPTDPNSWSNTNNWNGHSHSQLTLENITNLYLYGTTEVPAYLEDRLRTKEEYDKQLIVRIDMQSYVEGPGQFAKPSETLFDQVRPRTGFIRESLLGTGSTEFRHDVQNNYWGKHGLNVTTNDIWFDHASERQEVFMERNGEYSMNNHSMYKLTDALVLGSAMAMLDPTLSLETMNSIFETEDRYSPGNSSSDKEFISASQQYHQRTYFKFL